VYTDKVKLTLILSVHSDFILIADLRNSRYN